VIREYREEEDRDWATARLDAGWGGPLQARRGDLVDVLALPGFVAEQGSSPVGLATFRLAEDECELAFLEAFEHGQGIGTALVDAVLRAAGGRRVWVVTTNDNLGALRFYQRRGFRLVELRAGAVDAARESLKPAIGRAGEHGIPIRDELELEWRP